MNQRYDLIAVSLLMFSAVFAAWISLMPIDLTAFSSWLFRWQTLASGFVTAIGVGVASWNVTRQMRLAARGREQDRIERELPGNLAALHVANRVLGGSGKSPVNNAEATEVVLEELKLKLAGANEFPARLNEMLPETPDATKRALGLLLYAVRSAVAVVESKKRVRRRAEHEVRAASLREEREGENIDTNSLRREVEVAVWAHTGAIEKFVECRSELNVFRNSLRERIASDRRRLESLRSLHERYLGL